MSDFDSLPFALSVCAVICMQMEAPVQINRNYSFTHWHFTVFFVCLFIPDGSQDCFQTFLPLGRIIGDHAVHPSCWLRLLSGAFPSVQTVSKVNPSAAVEWARCRHRVCQVRFSFFSLVISPSHVCHTCGRLSCPSPNGTIRNGYFLFCCQAGVIGSGRHGHFSRLHHCLFLWGHHRGPVSPVMLLLV